MKIEWVSGNMLLFMGWYTEPDDIVFGDSMSNVYYLIIFNLSVVFL